MTDKTHDGLWVTDAELIRRSGVPEKIMRDRIRFFDDHPGQGFPPKNALFGNRRYWPAVMEFFARNSGTNANGRGTMGNSPIRSKAHASG